MTAARRVVELVIKALDQALADLDGPDPIVTRVDIVKRDLAKLRFHLRQGLPAEPGDKDALSRVALLLAAILTADGTLSQAAADVLPPRAGNITYRRHIENWLREGSREEIT